MDEKDEEAGEEGAELEMTTRCPSKERMGLASQSTLLGEDQRRLRNAGKSGQLSW